MKRLLIALLMIAPSIAAAEDKLCLNQKYDGYIDASLNWYQDLVTMTTAKRPQLSEVSQWFLEGRQHHFELNRAAFHYYLDNDPSQLNTTKSVESWLQLSQTDVKRLANRSDQLGQLAKQTFDDRQARNHEQNYELRSAFAELLSHPKEIEKALNRYNSKLSALQQISCD